MRHNKNVIINYLVTNEMTSKSERNGALDIAEGNI